MLCASILLLLCLTALPLPLHAYQEKISSDLIHTSHLVEPDSSVQSQYRQATQILLIFDNDDTLRPQFSPPSPWDHQHLIQRLLQNPKVKLWVISARSLRSFQSQYEGIDRINLAGNLGEEMLIKDGHASRISTPSFPDHSPEINQMHSQLLTYLSYANHPRLMGKKNYILFQHREVQDYGEASAVREKMQELASQNHDNYVYKAGNAFDTLSHREATKGRLVESILENEAFRHRSFFGMTFGNEEMDESMHRAMKDHRYGTRKSAIVTRDSLYTWADFKFDTPAELHKFLDDLVQ